MNDLISRAALLEFAHNHIDGQVDCNDIARFPSVDAEPVVHCRDCRYFKWGDYCTQDKMEHSKCRADDFCSYGKRHTLETGDLHAEVLPRFQDFVERNDDCNECPYFDEECDGSKRCFAEDILELLKRMRWNMNNDLISRAALLSDLNELYMAALRKDGVSVESIYELDHLSMLVKDAPAVDAEPVVHGKWVVAHFPGDGHRTACTNCGCPLRNPPIVPYNYCPNCGARMDGDKDGK